MPAPTQLMWTDTLDLALALAARFPGKDPLSVRFTDLHLWCTEVPGFSDDPKKSNEKILETIQMAWLDEVQD
jgi:FeS assembly protein IscX